MFPVFSIFSHPELQDETICGALITPNFVHILIYYKAYKDTSTSKQPKKYVQHAESGHYFGYLFC